jgi:hypothetical protein
VAETLSRANFARLLGVNRSSVTRWAESGRLVLDAGGRVEVEASRQRLAETSAGRDDVAARHAIERGAAIPEPQAAAENAPAGATGVNTSAPRVGGESRSDAQARKEAAAADLLEIELAQKRGQMIPKEDVDAALKAFAASVRARLDVLADQLAPMVAPVADLDEVHALLSEHARGVLSSVADDMARAAHAAGQGMAT